MITPDCGSYIPLDQLILVSLAMLLALIGLSVLITWLVRPRNLLDPMYKAVERHAQREKEKGKSRP